MHGNSSEVGRDAFDFIEKVRRLSTANAIMDAMRAAVGRFGCEYLCFNFLPTPEQNFQDVLLANTLPAGWLKLYTEKKFVHADPSIRHCNRMLRPYRWFKDSPYDPENDPDAVEVVDRAADFGLLDGVVIPIAALANRVGHVWVGGRALDLPVRDMPALHLMAIYAFDRVLQLHRQVPGKRRSLTSREREVLTWVARGKSAWEIGEILNISERTVHEHTANARRKLDAASCAQAVMVGLRDGIIEP